MDPSSSSSSCCNTSLSRRWIWVHHITNISRCKSIVEEANELGLTGLLKSGYPGVLVIEGSSIACDTFVSWIKGNKSRPNGFGRNWGHHVRGEIEDCEPKLQISRLSGSQATKEDCRFVHLGEELKIFSAACADAGLEAEFLSFVLQH